MNIQSPFKVVVLKDCTITQKRAGGIYVRVINGIKIRVTLNYSPKAYFQLSAKKVDILSIGRCSGYMIFNKRILRLYICPLVTTTYKNEKERIK
ncbi:hypothetical protein CSV71_11125 [Sporosarcina sp. P21c]|nr:hypothetical protein CSV71_11125 [Sporosarcina sp. P21c]